MNLPRNTYLSVLYIATVAIISYSIWNMARKEDRLLAQEFESTFGLSAESPYPDSDIRRSTVWLKVYTGAAGLLRLEREIKKVEIDHSPESVASATKNTEELRRKEKEFLRDLELAGKFAGESDGEAYAKLHKQMTNRFIYILVPPTREEMVIYLENIAPPTKRMVIDQ